jgi:3-hydroxyacyl-CoA dehydrogenase
MTAHYALHDDVAVITLDNPPVNGLGLSTRRAFAAAMQQAQDDGKVQAIVISGAGKAFCGGADITEFGTPVALQEPNLHSLIRLVERCEKPVVAALHSAVVGGGLELALACHYRIAAPAASLALPEVKLGLIPGAGGTQRLPRALGVEAALKMIVSGEPEQSESLASLPGQKLINAMASSLHALPQEALALARQVATLRPLPRVCDLPCEHPQAEAFFHSARSRVMPMAGKMPAPLRCVDAVEAATRLPFEEGLAYEIKTFIHLMSTPESRALRYLFFAERAASKVPGVSAETPLRPVGKVAVVGAGTMGSGIAMNFLNAGLPVTLLERSQEALDRGVVSIRRNYESQVSKGKLKPGRLAERMALLHSTLRYEDLRQADLLIEAVFEDMAVKEAVFLALDAVARPGAILASNTSTLDLNHLADLSARPQDVVGLHFFSPAHVMKLLEVVRGARTSAEVMATVMGVARKIRKTAVVSGVCDGFIGNRMIEQYVRQAGFLLDEGCTPAQVDQAMEAFGFAMGPFRMSDLAGNDIGWAIRKRRYREHPKLRYSKTADLLCEQGRFGQKTGAGWYDYAPSHRDAQPSAQVLAMIDAHRASLGIQPRQIGDEEIVQRLVFALVNEAARILDEGIASKASDIDIIYLYGYGFPAYRGGPMHYANELGLVNVVQAIQRFAKNPLDDAGFWTPAPLLARLAFEGKTF